MLSCVAPLPQTVKLSIDQSHARRHTWHRRGHAAISTTAQPNDQITNKQTNPLTVRTLIESIQNLMRQDTGVDGDAQRISQRCWMFFLKLIDEQDHGDHEQLLAELNQAEAEVVEIRNELKEILVYPAVIPVTFRA